MDLPVEATVHLNVFPNEAEVREILRSHGFELRDLSSGKVRVKGSFLKLKAAKESLEQLLRNSQTKTDIAPVTKVSSGAISKIRNNNSSTSNGTRSRLGSRDKPPHASPSSPTSGSSYKHPAPPEYGASFTARPDQGGSLRPGRESFIIDVDVFTYADRLRKEDIEGILDRHNVQMKVCEVGDSIDITLLGKSAKTAVCNLQSLLSDLSVSLRTQEVPLKDMGRDGQALLERIQKDRNIHNSVLVCPMNDKLHLIGPSGQSYELKQRLLRTSVDQSGRTGRTLDDQSGRKWGALDDQSGRTGRTLDDQSGRKWGTLDDKSGRKGRTLDDQSARTGRMLDDQSGRKGRTLDRNSQSRSHSLPPRSHQNTEKDNGAIAKQSPVRAEGYTTSKYQGWEAAETEQVATSCFGGSFRRSRRHPQYRGRSRAEGVHVQEVENYRERTRAGVHVQEVENHSERSRAEGVYVQEVENHRERSRAEGVYVQEVENYRPPPSPIRKFFTRLLNINTRDIKKQFKSVRRKK